MLAPGLLLCWMKFANLGPELNCSGLQRRGRALLPNSTLIPLSLFEGMPNYSFTQGSHQSWCGPGWRATCGHGLYLFCSELFTKHLAQCQPEHSPERHAMALLQGVLFTECTGTVFSLTDGAPPLGLHIVASEICWLTY